MVKPFRFSRLPLIVFGNGKISELPVFIKKYGRSVILVTGRCSFINSPAGQNLITEFRGNAIIYEHLSVAGEPSPRIIDEAVSGLSNKKADVVIAIGGGSVMDAGKAISAMMYKTGSVTDYLEGVGKKEHPGTKIPLIAIPTTSGTGSEATKNAVISQTGKNGFKRSLRHDNFVPDIAIVDPGLTLNCPPGITAASGMDCFTQLTEAYLSPASNEYSDALAIEGLKEIKRSLIRSYNNGDDIEARTGMSFAALTSGICLANAGLGVVHGFASSIGGLYNIPHGVICGTLMAKSNEINVRELRKRSENSIALRKYALLGKIFLDEQGKQDDHYIDGFISLLHKLTGDIQLPRLQKYGLGQKDIEVICHLTESKNNPIKLTLEDLMEILSAKLL